MPKSIRMLLGPEKDGKVQHFSQKFIEALKHIGLDAKILRSHPKMLEELKKSPTDLTCSFGRIDKLADGKYHCDHLEIPHVAILTEPLAYGMDLLESPFVLLMCTDRCDASMAKKIYSRVCFLPLASQADVACDENRDIDVLFFGDVIDYLDIRKEWSKKLSAQHKWVLEFASDILLINSSITLSEALITALEATGVRVKFGDEQFLSLYSYLEKFFRNKDRFELLSTIRGCNVHVYGSVGRLANKSNLSCHPKVCYEEKLALLQRAKICLSSSPACRDGADDNVFTTLAFGALPIASDSLYLSETFTSEEDLFFYKANRWDQANEWINSILGDEEKRRAMIARGKNKVAQDHTWNSRARGFMEIVSKIRT